MDRLQTYTDVPGEPRRLTDPIWALCEELLEGINVTEPELKEMPFYRGRDDSNWRGPVHLIDLPKLQRFIDGHHEDPMTTCQVFAWVLNKAEAGEIVLDPQARHTFTRFLQTEKAQGL